VPTKTKTNITINGAHHKVDGDELTGLQLRELGDIPAGNLLFREVHGPGDDEQILDEALVQLHNGDKFYDMPAGNFG
jgi:hypothetical protein